MRILEERKDYILRYQSYPIFATKQITIYVTIEAKNKQGDIEIWCDLSTSTNLEKTLRKSSKKLIKYFKKGFK